VHDYLQPHWHRVFVADFGGRSHNSLQVLTTPFSVELMSISVWWHINTAGTVCDAAGTATYRRLS